jgi:archaeal preflagellin peptidase FlaK
VVALDTSLLAAQVLLLLVGFGYAAVADLRTREVSDVLWQLLGTAGLVLGALLVAPGGWIPLGLWLLVAFLTLQHMFAWDVRLGSVGERYADLLEIALYVGVIALVALAVARVGFGASGVPLAVVAVLISVLFARGLFELGVLFGGADAKALMVAGLLVPVWTAPLFVPSSAAATLNALSPFSITLLMDAAIASVAVPIGLAARNLARREFSFPRAFTGYSIPVAELPDRFVWVRDPAVPTPPRGEEAAETAEEDRARRAEIAKELGARGISRVWVTPQIPFVVVMTVGAVVALVAGNLVIDILALL